MAAQQKLREAGSQLDKNAGAACAGTHSHQCSCLYTGRTVACFAAAGSAQHRPSRDSPTPLPFALQARRHQPRAYAAVMEQKSASAAASGQRGRRKMGPGTRQLQRPAARDGVYPFSPTPYPTRGLGCRPYWLCSGVGAAAGSADSARTGEHRRGAGIEPFATGIGDIKIRACARQRASARASGGRGSTCLQANTLVHRLLGDQMDHLVALLDPLEHEASQRRARSAAGGRGCMRKRAADVAPGGRPRHLLVFAPRDVRAGGTWQMLRAHLRQNHSAIYSSQTEQSSSPIVLAASPLTRRPGHAPCAGLPSPLQALVERAF